MEEMKQTTVVMTAEEKAEFEAFQREKAKKAAEEKAKNDREMYKQMVDEEIANSIPVLLGIKHITIDLGFMHQYFKSSLLEGADAIPEGHYADDNMKSTVVPFRNGIMLSIAIGIAESNNLKKVLIANHGGDHTIYPDCRPEFIKAIDEAAEAGTFVDVRVVAPYTNITKGEIAAIGKKLGIDYAETWSCYKGGEKHCGKCGTCVERKEALAEAGIEDTTEYEE